MKKLSVLSLFMFLFLLLCIPGIKAEAKEAASASTFNAKRYADDYSDLKQAYGYDEAALFRHYVLCGSTEGRTAYTLKGDTVYVASNLKQSTFNYTGYADLYPDLKAAFGYNKTALYNHYINYGIAEKRTVPESTASAEKSYIIRVNIGASTVTVYEYSEKDGEKAIKAFLCSANDYTPQGTYSLGVKRRWGALYGGVYGQYTIRIFGAYLFHSVPYFTMNQADLDYEAFNLLGTNVSAGCIRMAVSDVKWIYDNCPEGSTVVIYSDAANPGPLGKPAAIKIDTSSPNRGWDPTDPDPLNPWNLD